MSKDQLKEERIKILDLLSKGIINAKEAETLLQALGEEPKEDVKPVQKKAPFRMLRIYVDSNDGDQVRVQIPIEFAKLLKSGKFAPHMDKSDLDIDQLIEMINTGAVGELVNIESADGDIVRIVVE